MNSTDQAISQKTVGEIVTENYHAAGVFKDFGIDFCCGGGISLAEACTKKHVDLQQVTQRLFEIPWQATSSGDNYKDWTPAFLVDYIINTHHQFVKSKTNEIAAYAAKVAKVHGGRHPENVEIYDKFITLSHELLQHLEAEESTVFPIIKKVYEQQSKGEQVEKELSDELKKQLELMIDDHEVAGGIMEAIRNVSNNFTPPEDACTTYRILYQNLAGFEEDLHKHVHLENNILFKKAEALIN